MPILAIITTVLKAITFVTALGNENRRLNAEILGILRSISRELELIRNIKENYDYLQMQELVYDIEKFICRLYVPSKVVGFVLSATGMDPRPADIITIRYYKEAIKSVYEGIKKEQEKISVSTQIQSRASSSSRPPSYTSEKDLLGFSDAKEDVLKLLSPAQGDRRVISIVGCKGSGKTALARAVYDDHSVVPDAFGCKAWVVVPERKDDDYRRLMEIGDDILKEILQQVRPSSSSNSEEVAAREACVQSTSEALGDILKGKRYLVCIDDLQEKTVWDKIKVALPVDSVGSRIVLTTNVHSIANVNSRGGYKYKIQCLDRPNSDRLLWSKALESSGLRPFGAELASECIFVKCGGLPLALVSAGNYLNGIKPLFSGVVSRVGKQLGEYIRDNNKKDFAEMRRAIVQCYDNLPDYIHKNCLFYASIFPRCHPINSKSLARRLIAEGLVERDMNKGMTAKLDFATECLDELINQSLIERVLVGNNSKVVERCKVQSIIVEFTMAMSLYKNFVTLISEQETIQRNGALARRVMIVQSSIGNRSAAVSKTIDMSTVRSLTIFEHDLHNRALGYFLECFVLQVLDLEGCRGLNDVVLEEICGLVFLKYLGLRKTDVSELPAKVKYLRLLQTLDIRETGVKKLAMEVIMLPGLAYLFGKFELQPPAESTVYRLIKFLSRESKLHTLSGILMDGSQGFEVVLEHAGSLKKVKLWCKNTPSPSSEVHDKRPAPSQEKKLDSSNHQNKKAKLTREKTSVSSSRDSHRGSSRPDSHHILKMIQSASVRPFRPGSSRTDSAPATAPDGGTPEDDTCASRLVKSLESSLGKRLESLSIDFNGVSNGFLGFLKTASTISSMKIRQGLGGLPEADELRRVNNLSKLHISSTGRNIQDFQVLQNLDCLEFLKLADDGNESWNGNFHVEADKFRSLHWLCFEAKMHPRISIEKAKKPKNAGMEHLASLLLLCPRSPSQVEESKYQKEEKMEEDPGIEEEEEIFGVNGISNLSQLNEVILHNSAPVETVAAWKRAANLHMNKPYVKKQPRVEEAN